MEEFNDYGPVDEGARGRRADPDRAGRHGHQHRPDQVGAASCRSRATTTSSTSGRRTASPLTPEQYQQARTALMAADAGRHARRGHRVGASTARRRSTPTAGQKSYGKMVEAHSPGGKEPLVRLGRRRAEGRLARARPAAGRRSGPRAGPARERLGRSARRPSKAFDAADAKFDDDGGTGLKPSEKFDQSMKHAGATGKMGSASAGEIEGMLDPAVGPGGSQRASRAARDGHGRLPGRARRAATGSLRAEGAGEVRARPRGGARSRPGGARGRRDDEGRPIATPTHPSSRP